MYEKFPILRYNNQSLASYLEKDDIEASSLLKVKIGDPALLKDASTMETLRKGRLIKTLAIGGDFPFRASKEHYLDDWDEHLMNC